MRKVWFVIRVVLLVALFYRVGVAMDNAHSAERDEKNDRRDTITCPARTTEDAQFILRFERLANGRARVTFACP